MRVGAVDIGTNSMRLLVTDGEADTGRWERVTGLGRGVDATGALSDTAISETLVALSEFGQLMRGHAVERRRAIATSASRDASNREEFFDAVAGVLGIRPELISGDEEARLAYAGATSRFDGRRPVLVSDVGGGSTEFVTADGGVSIDIGSVRLTERAIPSRPAPATEMAAARSLVGELFSGLSLPEVGSLIGVAGTWTELPALAGVVPRSSDPHGTTVTRSQLEAVVGLLSGLSVEATIALALHPRRAPVMLGGLLIAEGVMDALGVDQVMVSIRDSLDGVAAGLLAGED